MYYLHKIYKDTAGYSRIVAELMVHDQTKEDAFLDEVRIKAYCRSGRLVVIEEVCEDIVAVPLLHLCTAERPRVCQLEVSPHNVREERRTIVQRGMAFNCVGRKGKFFIVNALALSVKIGCPYSAV